MPSLLLPPTGAVKVLVEVGFARWHVSADCPVLLAQPEAFVHPTHDPGAARACTICALPAEAAAAP